MSSGLALRKVEKPFYGERQVRASTVYFVALQFFRLHIDFKLLKKNFTTLTAKVSLEIVHILLELTGHTNRTEIVLSQFSEVTTQADVGVKYTERAGLEIAQFARKQ